MTTRPQTTITPGSKAAALLARMKETRENTAVLRELWIMLLGEPTPGDHQFVIWLNRYTFEIIEEAFKATAEWLNRLRQAVEIIREGSVDENGSLIEGREPTEEEIARGTKTLLDMIRYASKCMSKMKAVQDGQA